MFGRDEVVVRRALEVEFGRVDADEWVLVPNEPVEWKDCLKVALYLTPTKSLSALLHIVLKLPLVRCNMQYFLILSKINFKL